MATLSDEGSRLGRYTLVRRIGVGGMGEVWLAKATGAHGFEKQVALKRILPQFSSNAHVINMLVDEARISVLLNHPNVVQVLELGEDNGEYFIAMEYVNGVSLSRTLRRLSAHKTRFEGLEACFIAIQVLEGLHAAHIQKDPRGIPAGIIHRDVSPQNILLSVDGQVKVIDFGIARARERLEVTRASTVKGKLRYMAPEQIAPKMTRGKPIDHRVDVFAAGILLYEMLAHRQRFSGDNEIELMDAILKEDTPDLVREGLVDRELMNILDTALEKDRDHRYADAAAFAAALRGYLYSRDPSFTAERIARRLREVFEEQEVGAESDSGARGQRGRRGKGTWSKDTPRRNKEVELTHTQHRERDRARGPALPTDPEDGTAEDTGDMADDHSDEPRALRRARRAGIHDRTAHGDADGSGNGDVDEDARDDADEDADDAGEDAELADHVGAAPSAHAMATFRTRLRLPAWPLGRRATAIVAGLFIGTLLVVLVTHLLRPQTARAPNEPMSSIDDTLDVPPLGDRPSVADQAASGAMTVEVRAEPATTRISLADRPDPKYVTPAYIKLPVHKTAELVFEADGYETVVRKVMVTPEMVPVEVRLAPLPVDLVIHVYPRDALVSVNGAPAKPGMRVLPGQSLEIRAEHPFGLPRVVRAVPRPGEPFVVELRLDEVEKTAPGGQVAHGTLVISSRPAGAEVFVDGTRLRGVTPVETKVLAGPHRVTVRAASGEQTFSVTVANGETITREAVLE